MQSTTVLDLTVLADLKKNLHGSLSLPTLSLSLSCLFSCIHHFLSSNRLDLSISLYISRRHTLAHYLFAASSLKYTYLFSVKVSFHTNKK